MPDIFDHGLPTCALCDKPVDRMEAIPILGTMGSVVVRVYCHGEMEEVRITDDMLMVSHEKYPIRVDGLAFQPKPALEAPGGIRCAR